MPSDLWQHFTLTAEYRYVLLLFALFVVPRILQRLRLPSAITSLMIGGLLGMGFGWFAHDHTIELLSTFGIVALFLFAGLELELSDLHKERTFLTQHLVIRIAMLALVTWAAQHALKLEVRAAALVALALLTPSAGFILDSLDSLGLHGRERSWIKLKAVSGELLALAALFVTLQSTSALTLGLSALALVAMIALLPIVFRFFAQHIVPHAPGSEFGFLLMVAVVCALATRALGVYYLVGAFVVGVAARRFSDQLPAMASKEMLKAVELFASFFVPFYFFHAGVQLVARDFSVAALLLGLACLAIILPLRLAVVSFHRRIAIRESASRGVRIAAALLPTLVFTLVIAQILRDRFQVSAAVFGGLIVYTLVNTLIPGYVLHLPPPEYDHPHVQDTQEAG